MPRFPRLPAPACGRGDRLQCGPGVAQQLLPSRGEPHLYCPGTGHDIYAPSVHAVLGEAVAAVGAPLLRPYQCPRSLWAQGWPAGGGRNLSRRGLMAFALSSSPISW
jgi:hypothetical protein